MQREISTFPISSVIKQKLIKAGFTLESDFKNTTPLKLCKETQLTQPEAVEVLRTIRAVRQRSLLSTQSAHELIQKELSDVAIVTFSQRIDDMLGGGIPVGKLTEFCGVPGIGKTQMSIQLCVSAQIPMCFGGAGGKAIFIDTEGSFVPERLAQVASAAVRHCECVAKGDQEKEESVKNFTVESILKAVQYFRCKSCVELIALSHTLSKFIRDKCNNVKVIVVDSLAFHFRHGWDDMAKRTRVLNSLAQSFIKIATEFNLAVVFVNQMTTKVTGQKGKVVPALGESWSHVSTNRIILFWQGSQRYANLFKSPNMKEDTVPYTVTADGIRDAMSDRHDLTRELSEKPAVKRARTDQ